MDKTVNFYSYIKTYSEAKMIKTNVMLLDEKADQWNSPESSETDSNSNKKLVYDKAA